MPARPSARSPSSQHGTPTDKQICVYIAEMCKELRQLARRPRFRTIAYLLDMARLEAERTGLELRD